MQLSNRAAQRHERTVFVVLGEHTLGYVMAEQPQGMGVLAGSVLLGGHDPLAGTVSLAGRSGDLRLATIDDFHLFRVRPPSDGVLPCPNPTPVVSECLRVGLGYYIASENQRELVELAVASFGHLIKSVALTRLSFGQFADAIAAAYDVGEPRTVEVVSVLRALHVINTIVPPGPGVLANAARIAATQADAKFTAALVRAYGAKNAGDMRYQYVHDDVEVGAAAKVYKEASEAYMHALRQARDSQVAVPV